MYLKWSNISWLCLILYLKHFIWKIKLKIFYFEEPKAHLVDGSMLYNPCYLIAVSLGLKKLKNEFESYRKASLDPAKYLKTIITDAFLFFSKLLVVANNLSLIVNIFPYRILRLIYPIKFCYFSINYFLLLPVSLNIKAWFFLNFIWLILQF